MSIVLKGKFIISWILDLMEELSGMKRQLQPRDWSVWPSVSLITVVRTDVNSVCVMDCVECHASGKHWTLKFSSAMIINHRPEKECPELPDPDNGQVHLSGRNFQVFIHVSECYFIKTFQNMIQITLGLDQSVFLYPQDQAVYTCDKGYTMMGASKRVCQTSGQWTGNTPECKHSARWPDQWHQKSQYFAVSVVHILLTIVDILQLLTMPVTMVRRSSPSMILTLSCLISVSLASDHTGSKWVSVKHFVDNFLAALICRLETGLI